MNAPHPPRPAVPALAPVSAVPALAPVSAVPALARMAALPAFPAMAADPNALMEEAGITPANSGLDGVSWNILGQVYVPKQVSADSFCWHATFPEETFVPPHLHVDQDEYIYVLEGRIDLILDGQERSAGPGELVRMPRAIPHAFFNNSGKVAKALFWAAPTGDLLQLYRRIHNLASPAEVARVAAEHGVHFMPPVSSAA